MNLIVKYGWHALLIAMVGDLLIPFILAPFYRGYSNTLMTISALGNKQSSVRMVFNVWMLLEGVLFIVALPAIYNYYSSVSRSITNIIIAFIMIFAIGACIVTCFFSVNETKDMVTIASKIHGVGSVIGFMVFLFVPLLLSILSFKNNENYMGVVAIVSFVIAVLFFVLFVMADKPVFANTIIAKEGLWQRLTIFFMYLPLGFISVRNILESL